MKKILFVLSLIVLIFVVCLICNESSFDPIKEENFKKLFNGDVGNIKKSCSTNFLGTSARGEFYEAYLYQLDDVTIDEGLPNLMDWENKEVANGTIVGKWKNCPLDSQTTSLYQFTLTANDFDKTECIGDLNRELTNQKNYYCHIYFNDLEQYFLLYSPDKKKLYYVRRKGF